MPILRRHSKKNFIQLYSCTKPTYNNDMKGSYDRVILFAMAYITSGIKAGHVTEGQ